jgi:hypothetical protein
VQLMDTTFSRSSLLVAAWFSVVKNCGRVRKKLAYYRDFMSRITGLSSRELQIFHVGALADARADQRATARVAEQRARSRVIRLPAMGCAGAWPRPTKAAGGRLARPTANA